MAQVIGNSQVGGAERHVLDLVRGLRLAGVPVRVLCPRPGPLVDELAGMGLTATCIEMVFPRPGDDYALEWAVVERIREWLEREPTDLVHTHLYPAELHAGLAAIGLRLPVLNTAHTLVVRSGDVLLARLGSVRTIATSRYVADLLTHQGLPIAGIDVVHNGVGPQHFSVEQREVDRAGEDVGVGGRQVVGAVARLSHEKGLDILLRAFVRVAQIFPTAVLVLVGDGPRASALRALAVELGLQDTVRFLGERSDVRVLNRLFDVFVLPSREDACPIGLLEAMAAMRASVATMVGGNAELITHGVSGVLVPPEKPAALADAIIELLAKPDLREAIGLAARAEAMARFTQERMLRETLAIYHTVASAHHEYT